jgi:hypothetical protein
MSSETRHVSFDKLSIHRYRIASQWTLARVRILLNKCKHLVFGVGKTDIALPNCCQQMILLIKIVQ